jgi:hypothetical protein
VYNKYGIMNKKNNALDDAFDESVQIKTQFIRKNGKLKMIRRKVRAPEVLPPKKQLFPINRPRK